MGIATGIAFDEEGVMFVGDRSGTIYQVNRFGDAESFAISNRRFRLTISPSDGDGKLYVTAPGLSSFDAIYRIDKDGFDEIFYRGLGRPQGIAFDRDGNLYVAACLQGRHGIVKISQRRRTSGNFRRRNECRRFMFYAPGRIGCRNKRSGL